MYGLNVCYGVVWLRATGNDQDNQLQHYITWNLIKRGVALTLGSSRHWFLAWQSTDIPIWQSVGGSDIWFHFINAPSKLQWSHHSTSVITPCTDNARHNKHKWFNWLFSIVLVQTWATWYIMSGAQQEESVGVKSQWVRSTRDMLEWLQVMLAYRYLHQRGVERHSGRSQCKPWSGTGLKGVVTTTGRDMHTWYWLQPDKPLTVHRHTLTFHPHVKWLGCAAQRHTRKDTHTHRHTQYGFHQHHRGCGVRTHTSAVTHGCTGIARGTHTYTCTYIHTHPPLILHTKFPWMAQWQYFHYSFVFSPHLV